MMGQFEKSQIRRLVRRFIAQSNCRTFKDIT